MLFESPSALAKRTIEEDCRFLSRYDRELLLPVLERLIRNDRWQCNMAIQQILNRHRFVEGKAAEMVRASLEQVRSEIAKAYSDDAP